MSRQHTDLNRTLEECQILLCLQETDLEGQEVIRAEEQECGMHPPDEWDLLSKLGQTRLRMDMINGECAAEARWLS
jgi:hypothetical protein